MTRRHVAALVAIATLVPGLTVAVVLADVSPRAREVLLAALGGQVAVLAFGFVTLVASIGAIAWWTFRSQHHRDEAAAAAIRVIAETNPGHRLPAGSPVALAVNALAQRHETAELRLQEKLSDAHAELRRERDSLLAVMSGLDVPVCVIDDRGRVLLVNPAARRALLARTRIAAGRSIFSVFDADDFAPLLQRAVAGERPTAVVRDSPIRLVRITGQAEPAMVLLVGETAAEPEGGVGIPTVTSIGLSSDLARPHRASPPREEWLATALGDLVFTVVDTETTGLHAEAGDKLVSIGAVRVDGGVVRPDDTFDALVNPGRSIPAESIVFHGITDEMVRDAGGAAAVTADFADYAADSVLVGHHVAFDMGFLAPAAADAGVALESLTLDTMLLSAVLDTEPEARHGLDAVTERYGVPVVGRHTALGDALATADVLVSMVPLLAEKGIVTLGDAIRASAETAVAKRMSEAA